MPKLKPINFDLIRSGDKKEIWRMIKDLLMLYPRGANQRHRKEEYQVTDVWRGKESYLTAVRANADTETWTLNDAPNRGYTEEQIYQLVNAMGFDGSVSEWSCAGYIQKFIPDDEHWSSAKMTRTVRRFSERTAKAYRKAIKSGELGDLMFSSRIRTIPVEGPRGIRWGWDESADVNICVPAKTTAEAEMLISTCFGHAIHPDPRYRDEPRGHRQGDNTDAILSNEKAVKQLADQRKVWERVIEQAKLQIENIDTLNEAIETYTMSAFTE